MVPCEAPSSSPPPTGQLLAAFAAIYFLWGANFLAIRYAAEAMPPFLMMGARYLIAAPVMLAWAWFKDGVRPARDQWLPAWIAGTLFFLGCHGLLAWAEQTVPSGVAALVLATIPLWMTLLDWAAGAPRPGWAAFLGLGLGLAGLVVLVGPGAGRSGAALPPFATVVLVVSALAWAVGSIVTRRVEQPTNVVLASGMQFLAGGASLIVFGLLMGEGSRLNASMLEPRGLAGLAYMIVAASFIGFTAYTWLLRVSTPTRVGTYAFVNPVVAIFIGWAFAGEPLSSRTLVATLVIVVAVALIVSTRKPAVKETKHDRAPMEGPNQAGAGG